MKATDHVEKPENLVYWSELSAQYHSHRFRFLSGGHRWNMFIVVVLSTLVIPVSAIENGVNSVQLIGGIAAILVLFELVFDIQGGRNLHHNLYKSYTLFSGDISSTPNPDENTVQRWNMRRFNLYAEEPPKTYRVLMAHVHNDLALRHGNLDDYHPITKCHHRWFMHFFTFPSYGHPTKGNDNEK